MNFSQYCSPVYCLPQIIVSVSVGHVHTLSLYDSVDYEVIDVLDVVTIVNLISDI